MTKRTNPRKDIERTDARLLATVNVLKGGERRERENIQPISNHNQKDIVIKEHSHFTILLYMSTVTDMWDNLRDIIHTYKQT